MTSTDELERLIKSGTPLPWMKGGVRTKQLIEDAISVGQDEFRVAYLPIGKTHNEQAGALADAALIVAAVNALPELLAMVKRLEEALEPFAEFEQAIRDSYAGHSDTDVFYRFNETDLPVGAFRRARAALNQETKP